MFLGSIAQPVRRAVSRLSTQCGIFNTSQPYRPPRPVTWVGLPFFTFTSSFSQFEAIKELTNNVTG
jgi:hypothetical protein